MQIVWKRVLQNECVVLHSANGKSMSGNDRTDFTANIIELFSYLPFPLEQMGGARYSIQTEVKVKTSSSSWWESWKGEDLPVLTEQRFKVWIEIWDWI